MGCVPMALPRHPQTELEREIGALLTVSVVKGWQNMLQLQVWQLGTNCVIIARVGGKHVGSLLGPEELWAFEQQQEQAGRGWAAQAEPKAHSHGAAPRPRTALTRRGAASSCSMGQLGDQQRGDTERHNHFFFSTLSLHLSPQGTTPPQALSRGSLTGGIHSSDLGSSTTDGEISSPTPEATLGV